MSDIKIYFNATSGQSTFTPLSEEERAARQAEQALFEEIASERKKRDDEQQERCNTKQRKAEENQPSERSIKQAETIEALRTEVAKIHAQIEWLLSELVENGLITGRTES